jgi:hypothetical protein
MVMWLASVAIAELVQILVPHACFQVTMPPSNVSSPPDQSSF